MTKTTLELIGAPTDVGASVRGAGMGPDALRVAGLAEVLARPPFDVLDRGNLAGPPTPGAAPQDGIRHLDEVVAWNRAVFEAVVQALATGHVPLLMGGDHCLAIGSISAVARHCRAAAQEPARDLAGRAHRRQHRGDQPQRQHPRHAGRVPAGPRPGRPGGLERRARRRSSAGSIDFIGIRSVDADEKQAIRQLGLQVFDMRHIDEHGMRNTMTEVLQDVDEDTHLHVSFDLDCLDPMDAPGVGTGVRGGPTYREMQLCMEMIADTGRLGSLDVVEINPALDVRNRTAELAVEFIQSLFGASTLAR